MSHTHFFLPLISLMCIFAVSCGSKSSVGVETADSTEISLLPPRQVIDSLIGEMIIINDMLYELRHTKGEDNRDAIISRFHKACSAAVYRMNALSSEDRREAYSYMAELMKKPEVYSLQSLGIETETSKEFFDIMEQLRIEISNDVISLFGKTIEFTDLAGTNYTLEIKEGESGEGDCVAKSSKGVTLNGRWYFGSKDTGRHAIKILLKDATLFGAETDWETVHRGVNFGDAHDYHNSKYSFYPDSPEGNFYICDGSIWPYFVSTDGFDEYKQYSFEYSVKP